MTTTLPSLQVQSISEYKNLLILVFGDQQTATKFYNELKENLVIGIIAMTDEKIAVQLKFRDIGVIWPDYVFSKKAFLDNNLNLITYQLNHNWTCGYYENGEIGRIMPLKQLVAAVW